MDRLISLQAAIDAPVKMVSEGIEWIPVYHLKSLPSAQPEKRTEERTETHACDLISRQAAIDAILAVTGNSSVRELYEHVQEHGLSDMWSGGVNAAIDIIIAVPSAQPEPMWIPCSERLPENIRPVIVTWKNTDPASYYQYIVGKHFTGTACYKNGKWYWYSSTTEDMLAEYGRYDSEEFDEAIECIAWMPLPEPYKRGEPNED